MKPHSQLVESALCLRLQFGGHSFKRHLSGVQHLIAALKEYGGS